MLRTMISRDSVSSFLLELVNRHVYQTSQDCLLLGLTDQPVILLRYQHSFMFARSHQSAAACNNFLY
jgi:hypothetical protein